MTQATLTIKGRVQGVFFRSEAQTKANELGLGGWIKNEADGSVTVCAQGALESVQKFSEWCRQGPQDASVENMDIHFTENPPETFKTFDIRY